MTTSRLLSYVFPNRKNSSRSQKYYCDQWKRKAFYENGKRSLEEHPTYVLKDSEGLSDNSQINRSRKYSFFRKCAIFCYLNIGVTFPSYIGDMTCQVLAYRLCPRPYRGCNLICGNAVNRSCLQGFPQHKMLVLKTTSQARVHVSEIVILHVCMYKLRAGGNRRRDDHTYLSSILRTTFINNSMNPIQLAEWKTGSRQYPPVFILLYT